MAALMRWSSAALALTSGSLFAAASASVVGAGGPAVRGSMHLADGVALLQGSSVQDPIEDASPKPHAKVKPAAKRKAALQKADMAAGPGADILDGVKQAVIDAKNDVGAMIKDMAQSVAKMVNDAVGDLRKSVVAMASPPSIQMLSKKASVPVQQSPDDDLAADLASEESDAARMAQRGAKKVIKTHRSNETAAISRKKGFFSGRSKFTEDVKRAIRDIYGMVHETYEGVAELVKNVTKDIRSAIDPLGQMARGAGYLPPPDGGSSANTGGGSADGQVGFTRRSSAQASAQVRAAVLMAAEIAEAHAGKLPGIADAIVARHTGKEEADQSWEEPPLDAQDMPVQDVLEPLDEAVQEADSDLQVMLSETRQSVRKMVAETIDFAFAAGDVDKTKQ